MPPSGMTVSCCGLQEISLVSGKCSLNRVTCLNHPPELIDVKQRRKVETSPVGPGRWDIRRRGLWEEEELNASPTPGLWSGRILQTNT